MRVPMSEPNTRERECVRELARRVAQIAASDENGRIKRRWRDVNALRKPDRPPVWCRPVGAWPELLPQDALVCSDPWLRSIEQGFRQILIKHDIGDDSPVEAVFPVHAVFDVEPANTWGVDVGRHAAPVAGGAWGYDPPLKDAADLDRLRLPAFHYNEAKTQAALSKAHALVGDILPVELTCGAPLGATLCTTAADLYGLSEMMLAMATGPDIIHRLMSHLRDGTLQAMRQVQETGLLTPNNRGAMTCSDPLGPALENGRHTYKDLWGMANSQEFDQVSPAMWQEFLLPYQMPIIEQFGLSGYGCCENLTHKIDGVLSIPNLRIFVCSAWTDLDEVIERVGSDYVIMWRQKAGDVVLPDDVTRLRRDLEGGMKRLKGCHVQVVLRELQSLFGHADRLHVWTRLAKEAAAKYS